ncbi:probable serine/threonine-protein kinase SIS8 isoform X2 [Malania oleifera]|uniref:probable serine/threonine-protein kinase SIS8 isoform X2 n=1 Tax=Malania oleifera TaxID=397392 RepID=UPI0025ADFD93|nr:probable serine/threonine-protein kinase SIS8 isoform X2 [Malania oleifera]
MKNLLKKLHIVSNQSEDTEGSSTSSKGNKSSDGSSLDKLSQSRSLHNSEHKPLSALSGWLNSVAHRHSPSPPSSSNANVTRAERMEPPSDSWSSGGLDVVLDTARRDSGSTNSRDPDIEEEYQIQLALELSAREDPEAVQIEAVKQISLGSCPPDNTPAEVVAYRYWNYNVLSYDDKILDGFYDVYGIMTESTSKMPSLVDLQGTPVSDGISWEAVLVNRAADANLLKLEQKALVIAAKSRTDSQVFVGGNLVCKLAVLVSDYMGGPVGDPDNMSRAWKSLSYSLRATLGSMVLPIGSLTIGLARHRALLFKVLADSVGIPCRLVKGQQHTGSDDVAMNFVKIDDGREYIVDVMADPGTLIPSDAAESHIEYEGSIFSASPLPRDIDSSHVASFSSGFASSFEEHSDFGTLDKRSRFRNLAAAESESSDQGDSAGNANLTRPSIVEEESKPTSYDCGNRNVEKAVIREFPMRSTHPHMHARSPSWTEGVSSPAVRRMKVKDVSQYMIDAAKENPQLAQKLHDVLLESGVVAPPNLFTEIYSEQLDASTVDAQSLTEYGDENKKQKGTHNTTGQDDLGLVELAPSLPYHELKSKGSPSCVQPEHIKHVEGLGISLPLEFREVGGQPSSSQPDAGTVKYGKNVPVAAAAAAAAAVVASSMVVAAAKSSTADSKIELPVTAAATATAAAVVATTAAVSKQYEHLEASVQRPSGAAACFNQVNCMRNEGDVDGAGIGCEAQGSSDREPEALGPNPESERISDRSIGNDSAKSEVALDDVAECEIAWEDITLGSYGEVYRGDWHGTEVAVKKFLDQDISGESLEEFKSEVRIMKKVRHPNVVLFMGAVTRAPNLSIVTEFLPRIEDMSALWRFGRKWIHILKGKKTWVLVWDKIQFLFSLWAVVAGCFKGMCLEDVQHDWGSLYRLIHRPNNQLDERRRLRMALDAARGMNYLHNCTPVIVHRDLKSPNLLVDKNWVVKVCDFGLSRMKHNTFLSSRSTAGTAEWMAPEVLRNEPSNEKCDVFSFGVILWELSTLQQPWGGMNPMQVVGAVGFQHRRLEIPSDMDPAIADIIQRCWQTDPKMRPSFSEIMAALKPLQKPISSSQVPRPTQSLSSNVQKGQASRDTEEPAN